MRNRFSAICACLLLAAGLTACDSAGTESASDSAVASSTETATESAWAPGKLCYVTGHGETDASELGSFIAQVEADGYTWEEITLSSIPEDADTLIVSDMEEDMTSEELAALNTYMDGGGHVLLLMSADDSQVRYKNLGNFLEKFCLVMDYDLITETDGARMLEDDPAFTLMDIVTRPDNMPPYSAAADEGTPYLLNARSFHFVYQDNFGSVKMDAMLQTAETAIAAPHGGTEDDPLTYENEKLTVMAYARDEDRQNASVVVVGASDFLTDAFYAEEGSATPVSLVHSALSWFMFYQNV